MSVLTLVRHGQASYMSQDYDKLSDLGELQCRKLAEFWLRHEFEFDIVIQGPAKRHARSAEIVAEEYATAGQVFPQPIVIPELDEFDAFRMMQIMAPVLATQDDEIRELAARFEANRHTPEAGRDLQKLFEAVCRVWCNGEYDVDGLESWVAFRLRVETALLQIREITPKSSNVVAFTSGGPIAASVGYTLGLSNTKAIEFVWLTRNASMSEFVFSGSRFSMASFNAIPHLDDRTLVTYR